MAETYSVRVTQEQEDAIKDMSERGDADNDSEAVRMLISEGMRQYGYRAGRNGETTLKWLTNRAAWVLLLVGVVWMATTLYLPVGLRLPAGGALLGSAGMFGVERVLERHEPRVSAAIIGLVGGENA